MVQKMTPKERFYAVDELREPDVMPVFPRIMAQGIYAYKGWKLSDISTKTEIDGDKAAEAFLASIKDVGYDWPFGGYMDHGFGVNLLGGTIKIPEKFGVSVMHDKEVVTKREDWPAVKKMLPADPMKDGRCRGCLDSIRIISKAVGDEYPLFAAYYTGISAANVLFRKVEALSIDASEDPEFTDELCKEGTRWCNDWIRAQYEAGCNSVCYLGEQFGTEILSPKMGERFILPYIADTVAMVKKEFGQKTYLHIHGDCRTPKGYAFLEKLVKECGVAGLHMDEKHDSKWVKENIVEKWGIPAGIIVHGSDPIHTGPREKIFEHVKKAIEDIGTPGYGYFMAPSCQILPATSNENFKAWVDATHKYGKYPLGSWKEE